MKALKNRTLAPDTLSRPAGGLEAEFTLIVDDEPVRPEDWFDDPRDFIGDRLLHRIGTSYHLPNGAAVYFDTGVIELATPAMELERGCFARSTRSLFDAITYVRSQLDAWERRSGRRARLQGFSTHYNVSLGNALDARLAFSQLNQLAWVLVHVVAAPVMLLVTNRLSTGVGARPRSRRIEVTADFCPDPERVAATGALVAGVVREMLTWPAATLDVLRAERVPYIDGFCPARHSSRRGWVARFDCYPQNPFSSDVDARIWRAPERRLSLRAIARRVMSRFEHSIRGLADAPSWNVLQAVLSGRAPSWLEAPERPAAYDDVGRAPFHAVERFRQFGVSRYERVLADAVAGRPLIIDSQQWTPIGVRGWSRIEVRRNADGKRMVVPIDAVLDEDAG